MKVLEETKKIMYDFPVELERSEMITLFEHARNNISEEKFEEIMIQWAMLDMIEKAMKEMI